MTMRLAIHGAFFSSSFSSRASVASRRLNDCHEIHERKRRLFGLFVEMGMEHGFATISCLRLSIFRELLVFQLRIVSC